MENKQTLITPEVERYRQTLGTVSPIKVAEMLGRPLHEGQKNIAKYFEVPLIHTWDEATWLLARRFGKTFLGEDIATTFMLTPEAKILVIAHSTSLADVWFKEVLKNLLSIPAIKDKVTWDKKSGIIEIEEFNTLFVCCSYLNASTRAIGKAFTIVLKDEHFLVPPEDQQEIYNLVTPTMTNYGSLDSDTLENLKIKYPDVMEEYVDLLGIKYGKQVILSTPRMTLTGSHAGLTYLKGLEKRKGFISFKHTIYESPFLTKEEIEHLRQTTAKDTWLQEYMCEFTRTTKTVFRNFNKDKHIIHRTKEQLKEIAPYCDMIVGLDAGIIDGNGASFVLFHNKENTYYVIDEHYKKDEIARDFLSTVKAKAEKWSEELDIPFDSIIWFYDPSALATAREATQIFDLTMNKAKNKRTEGVDYINELLQGIGDEQIPRLYFLDTCETHISMFEYAEFKVISGVISNQFAKDPSERQSHYECCVTTIYACYSHNKTSNNTLIIT